MEFNGILYMPDSKVEKARRELEANRLKSDQVKQHNTELQQEMAELDRCRKAINDRLLQNGREIRAYADREQTLTKFLELAEEI